MKFKTYILLLLFCSYNMTTQCKDTILWDHGIIIKDTKKEETDIKFSLSGKEVLPTLEHNIIEPTNLRHGTHNQSTPELYSSALIMYNNGHYNHARIYLEECYSRNKKDTRIAYSLAQTYAQLAGYNKGIVVLENQQEPSEDVLMLLSILHQKNNNHTKAKRYIEKLLRQFPNTDYKRIITLQ